MPEEESRKRSAEDIFNDFFGTASISGIAHLSNAGYIRRIFWTLVIVGFLIGFSVNVVPLVNKFHSYPTTTVKTYRPKAFIFPDVTICPEYPMTSSYYESSLVSKINTVTDVWRSYFTAVLNMDSESANVKAQEMATLSFRSYSNDTEFGRLLQKPLIGYCIYANKQCNQTNFLSIRTPSQYGCVTFSPDFRKIERSRSDSGLNVGLRYRDGGPILSSDRKKKFTQSSYIVTLHERDTPPSFSLDSQITLEKGKLNMLKLRQKKHVGLQTPTKNCQKNRNDGILYWRDDSTRENVPFITNSRMCQEYQFQKRVLESCGCFSDYGWIPQMKNLKNVSLCHQLSLPTQTPNFEEDETPQTAPPINITDTYHKVQCLNDLISSTKLDDLPTCSQTVCDTISYEFRHTIKEVINAPNKLQPSSGDILLQIFPISIDSEEDEEVISYDTNQLMSDVGGQLAVWISCSFMALVELLELGLQLSYFGIMRVKQSWQKKFSPVSGDEPNRESEKHVDLQVRVENPKGKQSSIVNKTNKKNSSKLSPDDSGINKPRSSSVFSSTSSLSPNKVKPDLQ